ncbi:opioid growth factor receptor-like protein 1 isoform X2 [Hyperolius riggenbachi]|uniref:opioid growth factor receptor-like protein 1 isoform X2 n=1 Tax=Hyperolius riggenbachi TaxID=752182 RepID=UPI0035A2A2F8
MRKSKSVPQQRARTPPYYDSEYDSTWEDAEHLSWGNEGRGKKEKQQQPHRESSRTRAARELQNYRHGYPAAEYEVTHPKTPNFDFYKKRIPFKPNGVDIEEVLEKWNNDKLERNHSYIQWLFPLREMGMNSQATPLTLEEIAMMKEDSEVMRRFLSAYKLMLSFYGIRLQCGMTGEVERSANYRERFENLDNHPHNNLRITRILKSLGELGYECLKAPLVRFFLKETLREGTLRDVQRSALYYFIFTVKSRRERRELLYFAWQNYEPKIRFIWGPMKNIMDYHQRKQRQHAEVQQEVYKSDGHGRISSLPSGANEHLGHSASGYHRDAPGKQQYRKKTKGTPNPQKSSGVQSSSKRKTWKF